MKNIAAVLFTSALIWLLLAHSGCRKDDDYLTGAGRIHFSTDTLLFDTVFTTLGSATRIVKVFNDESQPLRVDIKLGRGPASFFRMNADGFSGKELTDVVIPAKDSIYIFLEVTIDPNNPVSVSPFVVEEDLIVSQQGQASVMKLIAWGQNANYLSSKGQIRKLTCDNQSLTFEDEKPYVIYGILVIDSCELIIPEGRSIHIHGGVVVDDQSAYNDGMIIFFPDGKLTVNGTVDRPVVFEGDRLEPEYADVEGQWVGLRFWAGSGIHSIRNACIKNGIVGIIADSASQVFIQNTEIRHTAGPGIIGIQADITAENVLLHNNGSNSLQLTYGGSYNFAYSTIVSRSSQSSALYLNNYRCTDTQNDPLCQSFFAVEPVRARFTNCIIYGPSKDEILLDDKTNKMQADALDYQFEHCLVRVDELLDTENFPNFFDRCAGCINFMSGDTLFRNAAENDFRLDTFSIVEQKAIPIQTISSDILGRMRDVQMPDMGCYEFEN